MIVENVKIHNRYSLEIKLGFTARKKKKVSEFAVNAWIFMPNSLDVNPATYEKTDFYRDLKSNIRLITPVYLMRDISESIGSPLHLLETAFRNVSSSPTRSSITRYEHHIKMFLSIMKSSLRDETAHIAKNMVTGDKVFLVKEYTLNTIAILKGYRDLYRIINVPTISATLMNYYRFGDEFLSNIVEQHTFDIISALQSEQNATFESEINELFTLISNEINYRKEKGFLIIEKNAIDNNREIVHRLNLLKKYAENVLFLSTRKKRDGLIQEQFFLSLAAGISMIFATAIAFSFQQKYGNLTMPFFVALVVSYVLKDRIKELSRHYFASKLGRRYFDHKTKMSLNNNDIGWSKEAMDFISESKVPAEVLRFRNRSAILEADNRNDDEKIILYRKLIRINRINLDKVSDYYSSGINDIIRFNVSGFMNKMDNPEVPLYHLDEKNSFSIINGEKIYFMNLVIQFKNEDQIFYRRYRLVVNREGIKYVETFNLD
jgi:hypothetical protein